MTPKGEWIGLCLIVAVALVGCAAQPGDGGGADTSARKGEQPTGQTLPSADQAAGVAAGAGTVAEPRSSHENAPISVNVSEVQGTATADADSLSLQDSPPVTADGSEGPSTDLQPDEDGADSNTSGVPDECDIATGTSQDCNTNSVADECDIAEGTSQDCNTNTVPDECDIAAGTSQDCNTNTVPDECDIAAGTSQDCNTNTAPDECDIAAGTSQDCNTNSVPDECDIAAGTSGDCNTNTIPDECDIASNTGADCNANRVPDECDIAGGTSQDCNTNAIPDECDIASNTSPDCNANRVPDECDIAGGTSHDCNTNTIPDECDIAAGTSEDCNTNSVPDECEPDTDGDGLIDDCDACPDSDLSDTIVIDGCDTEVDNVMPADDGCTMADRISQCAEGAKNHGAFVSCVAHLTNEWKEDGRISGRKKGRIQRCAAQADIP